MTQQPEEVDVQGLDEDDEDAPVVQTKVWPPVTMETKGA